MNSAFHHKEDHHQFYNGFFDILNSDQSHECLSIGDTIINPFDKYAIKFDDIKLPSNEIMNYEVENQDYYKSFDYENMNEEVFSPEVDIEPLSWFAEKSSEACSVFAFNHGNSKDTDYLSKISKTKETSYDSGETTNPNTKPNAKINEAWSDTLPKEATNQRKKTKKAKETRSATKELSTKSKRFRMFGYSRWGRKEDTRMFSVLRQLWKQESVDIEDFYTNHSKISIEHDLILINLVSQLNWRSDTQSLLKRIQSLAKDQTLSVRQIYMLKRLKRKAKQQKKEFSLEDIVDSFPGKSISTLQSALEQHPCRF